ncbi:hypothetical protein ABER75_11440 [Niallia taxi]|uniref:hypothetical protein n=1 Tax=Niallia taxi TaxID=2499688 RepID=UPI00203F57E6|nr:hypothetical protein [Niallia taxi]MCM3216707.1 hypothetical protein [Niallia taxi]
MKRLLLFKAATFLLLLVGCSNADISDADFEGAILEVSDKSIIVGEDNVNPEASFESYEVLIDDNTEFTGDITSMEQLPEEFDEDEKFDASLWVKDKGENNDINNKVVTKINIEK